MRRKRKPRVVWLPQTNANTLSTDGTANSDTVYNLDVFNIGGPTGTTTVVELPLVLDAQTAIEDTGATLADIESSGYRLRRIVGKVWIQCGQTEPLGTGVTPFTPIETPLSVIVTAGIMVRHARTDTGASTAVGTGTSVHEINPGLIINTGDPWVWRRSWIVGNNWALGNVAALEAKTLPVLTPINPVPPNNYSELAGGIADGPHIDQKTARIVGPEERLFLDVSATVLGESPAQPGVNCTIAVITDLRVLGSLRMNAGNRRNSSR